MLINGIVVITYLIVMNTYRLPIAFETNLLNLTSKYVQVRCDTVYFTKRIIVLSPAGHFL